MALQPAGGLCRRGSELVHRTVAGTKVPTRAAADGPSDKLLGLERGLERLEPEGEVGCDRCRERASGAMDVHGVDPLGPKQRHATAVERDIDGLQVASTPTFDDHELWPESMQVAGGNLHGPEVGNLTAGQDARPQADWASRRCHRRAGRDKRRPRRHRRTSACRSRRRARGRPREVAAPRQPPGS